MSKNNLHVPDTLYTRPTVITTNEHTALPDGVLRGRAYTEYKLTQLCDKLANKRDDYTRAELLELVKLAGTKQTVQVTCKSGSVFTHIQPAATNFEVRRGQPVCNRFTGWNGHAWATFHPSNVKSFRILGTWETPANELSDEDQDLVFYY